MAHRHTRACSGRPLSIRMAALAGILLPTLGLLAPMPAAAQATGSGTAAAPPVWLEVLTPHPTALTGSTSAYEIVLRNAKGEPAPAVRDTTIDVTTITPSGEETTRTLPLAAGQSTLSVEVTPWEPGLQEIIAREPNLLEGKGTLFAIETPAQPLPRAPWAPLVPHWGYDAVPEAAIENPPLDRAPGQIPLPDKLLLRPDDQSRLDAPGPWPAGGGCCAGRLVLAGVTPRRVASTNSPPDSVDAFRLRLSVNMTDAGVLAGLQPARVQVFLTRPAATPVTVVLATSHGRLERQELTIPAGGFFAETVWTAATAGTGTIAIQSSTLPEPRWEVHTVPVRARPPITGIRLAANEHVMLLDRTDVRVNLVGPDDRAVETDEDRAVTVWIQRGDGSLAPREMVIPSGSYHTQATLSPHALGAIQVFAETANYDKRDISIQSRLGGERIAYALGFSLLGAVVRVFASPALHRSWGDALWNVAGGVLAGVAAMIAVLAAMVFTQFWQPVPIASVFLFMAVPFLGAVLGLTFVVKHLKDRVSQYLAADP